MLPGQFRPVDDFDRELLRNVKPNQLEDHGHPVGSYEVPEGSGRYNLVVVGAGAGGLVRN